MPEPVISVINPTPQVIQQNCCLVSYVTQVTYKTRTHNTCACNVAYTAKEVTSVIESQNFVSRSQVRRVEKDAARRLGVPGRRRPRRALGNLGKPQRAIRFAMTSTRRCSSCRVRCPFAAGVDPFALPAGRPGQGRPVGSAPGLLPLPGGCPVNLIRRPGRGLWGPAGGLGPGSGKGRCMGL